jgi:hypothetical protein
MDMFSMAAFKGALDVGDRLLEIYKIKTDGTFYERKEFESRLHEREDSVKAERKAALAADSDWRGLEIQLATLSQTDRINRLIAANPFCLSVEDTRDIAEQTSLEGSYPVLLEAPIGIDKRLSGDSQQDVLDLSIGQRWGRHPCAADVKPLSGVISRPLYNQDVDVHIIANTLSNVPVILTYGYAKADGTLWVSVYAWNIIANEPQRDPLKIALPGISYPDISENSEAIQEWKDEISRRIQTIIALLAQWFFLVHHGRKPTLEKLTALDGGSEIRALLARQLVAAYEIVASQDNTRTDIRLDQAELFADAGMNAQASVFALSILDQIRQQLPYGTDFLALERLIRILGAIGDHASTIEAKELLESRSRITVQRILGWAN